MLSFSEGLSLLDTSKFSGDASREVCTGGICTSLLFTGDDIRNCRASSDNDCCEERELVARAIRTSASHGETIEF